MVENHGFYHMLGTIGLIERLFQNHVSYQQHVGFLGGWRLCNVPIFGGLTLVW